MKFTSILAVGSAIGGVFAFWRMECRGRSGIGRIDPMMSPKEISQHVHVIHGSAGFSEVVQYEDLTSANCTSCAVTQDKSAYWSPGLYFQHANGSFELVPQVGGMLAYYFLNADAANPNGSIKAFPEGFRMIAGDTVRRNYSVAGLDVTQPDPAKSFWTSLGQTTQSDLAQRAVGFNCLNYDPAVTPESTLYRHYFPTKDFLDSNCLDGIRIELMFPSCWNGQDLDSENHQDHVAYPDLVLNGACPSGFETKLPGLFYETIWNTYAFKGQDGQFVVSNGDPTGFGYHGDFIMGWESEGFLQNAVDTCLNPSGRIEDCPLFTIQDEATQNQCSIDLPAQLLTESVTGMVGTVLPGNVAIQSGPQPATVAAGATAAMATAPAASAAAAPIAEVTIAEASEASVPTEQSSPSTTSASTTEAGGGVFLPVPTAESPAVSTDAQQATVNVQQAEPTPAPEAPSSDGNMIILSTQFITSGGLVTELIWEQEVVYVTEETSSTTTITLGGDKARRGTHLHRHLGSRGRFFRH